MTAIHESIEEYLAALAVEGKARCTVEVYGARLRRFADWCASQGKVERNKTDNRATALTRHTNAFN